MSLENFSKTFRLKENAFEVLFWWINTLFWKQCWFVENLCIQNDICLNWTWCFAIETLKWFYFSKISNILPSNCSMYKCDLYVILKRIICMMKFWAWSLVDLCLKNIFSSEIIEKSFFLHFRILIGLEVENHQFISTGSKCIVLLSYSPHWTSFTSLNHSWFSSRKKKSKKTWTISKSRVRCLRYDWAKSSLFLLHFCKRFTMLSIGAQLFECKDVIMQDWTIYGRSKKKLLELCLVVLSKQ